MTQHAVPTFVFDLDDTLYPERDYVRSGFSAVGVHMAAKGVPGFGKTLWDLFEDGVRGDTFNRALAAHDHPVSPEMIKTLVEIYRTHAPVIALSPDAASILDHLDQTGVPYGVITDGPLVMQRAKIAALNLETRAGIVICTDAYGCECWKPHPRAFEKTQAYFNRPGPQMVYVGDNPTKDFKAPRDLGWLTVRLRHAQGEHAGAEPVSAAFRADAEIATLDDLITTIDRLRAVEAIL